MRLSFWKDLQVEVSRGSRSLADHIPSPQHPNDPQNPETPYAVNRTRLTSAKSRARPAIGQPLGHKPSSLLGLCCPARQREGHPSHHNQPAWGGSGSGLVVRPFPLKFTAQGLRFTDTSRPNVKFTETSYQTIHRSTRQSTHPKETELQNYGLTVFFAPEAA